MSLSKRPGRVLDRVQRLLRGARRELRPGDFFMIGGVSHDQTSLVAKFEAVVAANEAAAMLQAQLTRALAVRDALHDDIRPFLNDCRDGLKTKFGFKNPVLVSFGIKPERPRRQRSAEEKAVSAAEGVRTRRLRGSYGDFEDATVEGKPGLLLQHPDGKTEVLLPPAPPGKPRPRKK